MRSRGRSDGSNPLSSREASANHRFLSVRSTERRFQPRHLPSGSIARLRPRSERFSGAQEICWYTALLPRPRADWSACLPRPGPLRAAWLLFKQTDLVPIKGSSARFHHPLSYCCPTTIFLGARNRHRHHLSATLLDGQAGNGWARLLRCGRDRSGGGFPNAGYEPHPLCGDCPLTAPAKKSGQDIPKNHAKRNCPLSGIRSVSLSHDHAALALRQSPTAGTGLWLQPPTRIYSMSERVATSPRLH